MPNEIAEKTDRHPEAISHQNGDGESAGRNWYVLWTRSHCEESVFQQLEAKGFELFLPRLDVWSLRAGRRHLIPVPLFPGYLFLRHAMDKKGYIEVRKARGLVCLLGGERPDRLAVVPDGEIEMIQRLLEARMPVRTHPYLKTGQRVRVIRGPLAGIEGILVQVRSNKGVLVLSVDLLQKSVAVQVDCTSVAPA